MTNRTDNDPTFAAFSHSDMQKYLEQLKWTSSFDMGSLLDMSRKNAQTLATLQQIGLEAWQEIITTSQTIAQELASEQAQLATSVMEEGAPEEKIAKAAERLKTGYERAHNRYKELADIQHKLSQDVSDLISRRIKSNLNDIKNVAGKDPKS